MFGVSETAAFTLGCSSTGILSTCIVGFSFAISPLLFRCRRLKSKMVLGGTNSLVLSAACHVPRPPRTSGETATSPDTSSELVQDDAEYLREVSRGKVRWGAMELPAYMAEQLAVDGDEPVFHLGFAGEDHHVREPRNGELCV
ncbi:hypothetical protein PG984_007521 [Apiospora sp. TS-2023a]